MAAPKNQCRFNVYVIALDKAVLQKRKFMKENPNYINGKPCVYVGMTAKTPDERFQQHKAGYKSGKYVKQFGRYMRRKLFERLNPLTYEEAQNIEKELAHKLKKKGYGVWWN